MSKTKPVIEGLCFEKALCYIIEHESDDLRLIHGRAIGRGPIQGIKFSHAWIEDSKRSIAIDLDKKEPKELPLIVYYLLGNITNVQKYTRKEAMEKALETRHYGPWRK